MTANVLPSLPVCPCPLVIVTWSGLDAWSLAAYNSAYALDHSVPDYRYRVSVLPHSCGGRLVGAGRFLQQSFVPRRPQESRAAPLPCSGSSAKRGVQCPTPAANRGVEAQASAVCREIYGRLRHLGPVGQRGALLGSRGVLAWPWDTAGGLTLPSSGSRSTVSVGPTYIGAGLWLAAATLAPHVGTCCWESPLSWSGEGHS